MSSPGSSIFTNSDSAEDLLSGACRHGDPPSQMLLTSLFLCFQKSDSEGWNMAAAAVAVAAILVLVVPRFTRA